MSNLGIDGGYLLAQVVNFFIIFLLLNIVLYRPVTRMLRERSERIAKGLSDAEVAGKRAAQAEADYQKRLEEARREAQAIVAQAQETAEKERQATLARAQAEAQELRTRVQEEVERERREALAVLQVRVADLAIDAAGKVLERAVDDSSHRQLVQDFLSHLEQA